MRSPTFPVAAGPEATIINAIYSWRSSAFVPAKLRRWYLRDDELAALSRTPGVTLVQSPAFAVIGERAGADQFDRTAMYLFAKTIVAGTPIKLFNHDNMQRDHFASRSGVWQVSTQS